MFPIYIDTNYTSSFSLPTIPANSIFPPLPTIRRIKILFIFQRSRYAVVQISPRCGLKSHFHLSARPDFLVVIPFLIHLLFRFDILFIISFSLVTNFVLKNTTSPSSKSSI
ncbi:unnamed protein product [Rhizophagus irregularis]|nr:unnamed protein product [Rhizophagus irregularis]